MKEKNYWVYILHCSNNSFYTGYTDNLNKRYESHLNGTGGCKYTRSFPPIKIAQAWLVLGDKKLALGLERFIKKQSRKDKIGFILSPETLCTNRKIQIFNVTS
jgi:putative endonuclease